MKKKTILLVFVVMLAVSAVSLGASLDKDVLTVVTTLPDYAKFVEAIGGDRVKVDNLVLGIQDPHNIRPKPSFVTKVKNADVIISTGLDLEMWLPTLIDTSGNKKVRSGEQGFVAVSHNMVLMDKPDVLTQALGDVHVEGNPHFTCSPLCMRKVAENITTGLIKNDPVGKALFEENLKELLLKIDNHLFGEELVGLFGGDLLVRMAQQGKLIDFLEKNKLQDKPLIGKLGGWLNKLMPMRDQKIVVYHKNWTYFTDLFGIQVAGTIEPKPGIPPSAKHVVELSNMMKNQDVRVVFTANYFD
ncbi:MAG: zinc ABC transporter substrate-binding protein, partial [Planctomycetes bacterium]|nr:zinc ABC transporter substrate-binding protein [Planctomycetota bacterium]